VQDGFEDLLELSDDELDRFVEELEAEDEQARAVLRDAVPPASLPATPHAELAAACVRLREGIGAGTWPYDIIGRAADFGTAPPEDDAELWLRSAGALISYEGDPDLDPSEQAKLLSLEHADWLGAVVGLVRSGIGASAEPEDLARYVDECPEVEAPPLDLDDRLFVETAFEILLPTWEATDAVDADRRLTALGAWGLPRALARAWGGDLERDDG
jgi:hypothetical protein